MVCGIGVLLQVLFNILALNHWGMNSNIKFSGIFFKLSFKHLKKEFHMLKKIFLLILFLFSSSYSFAALKTQVFDYTAPHGVSLQGYLAYEEGGNFPKPGILVVHDWMGEGKFTEEKARVLAQQGYVVLAVDIYGKGIRPKDTKEAGEIAGKFKNDRALLRERIQAAYKSLVAMKQVDPNEIIVMGYCFGGMTALELARSGVKLAAAVSFHGTLNTPTPEDAKKIKGKVLVFHGAEDPFVPPAEVQAFKKEMKNAGVDLKFIAYPGAVHSFTNPAAGNDKSKGAAYDAKADQESWRAFEKFLSEVVTP